MQTGRRCLTNPLLFQYPVFMADKINQFIKKKFLRIDRIVSNFGYCTRSQARAWVKEGRITLNGSVVADVALKADPHDLLIDSEPIDHPDGIYVIINKPEGYICSHDTRDGAVIYSLLPFEWMARNPAVSSAGRLDKDTTGLLVITDDSAFNHRITSPAHHVSKIYRVEVDKPLDESVKEHFENGGLMLDSETKPCMPAGFKMLSSTTCEITLHEGRYHQVKRMFTACGFEVQKLHRTGFGNLTLDELSPGEYREFDPQTI